MYFPLPLYLQYHAAAARPFSAILFRMSLPGLIVRLHQTARCPQSPSKRLGKCFLFQTVSIFGGHDLPVNRVFVFSRLHYLAGSCHLSLSISTTFQRHKVKNREWTEIHFSFKLSVSKPEKHGLSSEFGDTRCFLFILAVTLGMRYTQGLGVH